MKMSDRLTVLLTRSQGRNLRAAFAHLDAAAIRDGAARVEPTETTVDDRFVRERIESGICWRDHKAGSPDIQARARA